MYNHLKISTDDTVGNKTDKLLVQGDICCFYVILMQQWIDSDIIINWKSESFYALVFRIQKQQNKFTRNAGCSLYYMWTTKFICSFLSQLQKWTDWRESESSTSYRTSKKVISRSVFLSDGSKFMRYPFLTYHDYFIQESPWYPQGSNGAPLSCISLKIKCNIIHNILSDTNRMKHG